MPKRKVSFQISPKEHLSARDLLMAFELADNIRISYLLGKYSNISFNPCYQEDSKALIPGLKIIFCADSEILFVVPVETSKSPHKIHRTMENLMKLNHFLGKDPIVRITETEIIIMEK